MDPLWIDDGFTRTHDIPAVPGLHPAVTFKFRPALSRESANYTTTVNARDAERIDKLETELIGKYVLSINEQPIEGLKAKLPRLHPAVKQQMVSVILGYQAARAVEEEVENLSSPSG